MANCYDWMKTMATRNMGLRLHNSHYWKHLLQTNQAQQHTVIYKPNTKLVERKVIARERNIPHYAITATDQRVL